MASSTTDPGAEFVPTPVKIIIAGGFGAGKTTMVGSVSEIPPLTTEEVLTEASAGVDDLSGVERKSTTTVALDFGRIRISQRHVLYLFGTPGQTRFWFMWNDLARGAIGSIVLLDTRRLDAGFPAIDFFERRAIPFIVVVNCFDNAPRYTVDEVRAALAISERVPIMLGDARDRESSKLALVRLVRHAIAMLPMPARANGAFAP
ncbi:ATP/GTP-binding protein [Actinomycetes bacterium KLBMP 9759]